MLDDTTRASLQADLDGIRAAGTWKRERVIASPQSAVIRLASGAEVLNFCANNYLGLADDPDLVRAAHEALDRYALGLASVRFICGTTDLHKRLERAISEFHGKDDTILYAACFDANGGLFETLLGPDDAVISDELNHASIIDGVRLSRCARYRFLHDDMADLEVKLEEARHKGARRVLVSTDGVFSMDGDVARLDRICELAERYNAMVHVDECHATGFFGPTGRGAAEHRGVLDRIDVITSTIGKALGGSAGGFTTGHAPVVDLLRQRSRPYLFSNTLPPVVAGAALAVFERLSASTALRDRLAENTAWFRAAMTAAGLDIRPGEHPIVPVMIGDAALATRMADRLLELGVYVIGFSYPVVPVGKARIRVQVSAAHTREHLERAVDAFATVARELGLVA
ncbi:MAG TPA: glycine C-acetyltransferase [Myxococcota bacterium]|nr:glycine C-acetyltransferase [Myxococcota bacterium]